MNRSEDISELAKALSKAQLAVENAAKNSANPHFRSRYADLAEIINTVRPVFSKHGISIIQSPTYLEGMVSVTTMLLHDSGQYLMDTISCPAQKLDPQGIASATTYMRRYSLSAFCGISQEDDDGNAASNLPAAKQKPAPAPTQAKKEPSNDDISEAVGKLQACANLSELKKAFTALPSDIQQALVQVKDELKEKLK